MSSNQNAPKALSFRYENVTAVPSSMTKLVAEILGNQLISATSFGCRGISVTKLVTEIPRQPEMVAEVPRQPQMVAEISWLPRISATSFVMLDGTAVTFSYLNDDALGAFWRSSKEAELGIQFGRVGMNWTEVAVKVRAA
ncbi:Uncharacterized protein Fot_00176 [Forsythia ovata]|uniref:Uncharacterized protein n=1 Tax=Forsythia ovata TaxID=205694 RepID=A0ABD1X0X7_9LAMI